MEDYDVKGCSYIGFCRRALIMSGIFERRTGLQAQDSLFQEREREADTLRDMGDNWASVLTVA